jgi:predicted enzyme related to lactoylglutathione lyase
MTKTRSNFLVHVKSYDNFFLPAADLGRAKDFYERLGLSLKFDFTDRGMVAFRVGREEPAIILKETSKFPDAKPAIWFVVDDVREEYGRLRKNGIVFLSEPFEILTGLAAEFEDPFGNRLGITDYSRPAGLRTQDLSGIKEEVWAAVQSMNRLWTAEDRADDLAGYFHERMVAISPSDKMRLEGREACVAAWKKFSRTARIHFWREIDPRIDLFGNGTLAVVTYYFEMSFELGGQTIPSSGRDMLTMVKENGRWWAVSDQFSSYP